MSEEGDGALDACDLPYSTDGKLLGPSKCTGEDVATGMDASMRRLLNKVPGCQAVVIGIGKPF